MTARGLLAASVALAALAGCSPNYVDRGKDETGWSGVNEVVFQVHDAYRAAPPACIAILPLTVKSAEQPVAKPEEAAQVRQSLFAHLSVQSKRLVRLERVDHVLAEVKGDRKALAERLNCPVVMEGEITEYGSLFLALYSRVAVGAEFKLVRAADGAVLWEGKHTASSNGGSIPLDPVGVAVGVVDAVGNLRDEQILRVTDDLTRRLVSTIPDTTVLALDDPAEPPPAVASAAPAPVAEAPKPAAPPPADPVAPDPVVEGEKLLAAGDHAGALAAAERAVAAEPKRADGWFLKGRVLMLDNDNQAAEPAILRAVALDGHSPRTLNALGAVNAAQGAKERALAAYRMAIDADPGDGFAWYNSGVIHYNAGDPIEAADAFYGAGLAYLKAGDYPKAERALTDLRDLSKSGIPVQSKIKTIEDALSDLSRRKT